MKIIMSMRPRVNQIVKSAYFHLRSIGKIRRYLDNNTCKSVVQALVISRLDYANVILTGLPDLLLRKLQLVQNNAARLITRTSRRDHITPVLKKLHWLPVHQRIIHKLLSIVYKALNSADAPSYIKDMLHVNRPERHLRSCDSGYHLSVARTHRCVGDRAFSVAGPSQWNKLPPDIQSCTSFLSFKRTIKTYLFKLHYDTQ